MIQPSRQRLPDLRIGIVEHQLHRPRRPDRKHAPAVGPNLSSPQLTVAVPEATRDPGAALLPHSGLSIPAMGLTAPGLEAADHAATARPRRTASPTRSGEPAAMRHPGSTPWSAPRDWLPAGSGRFRADLRPRRYRSAEEAGRIQARSGATPAPPPPAPWLPVPIGHQTARRSPGQTNRTSPSYWRRTEAIVSSGSKPIWR